MKPAEGTNLLILENQGVLFHEPSQKLFHLNTTAAFIWHLLEENKAPEVIEDELQSFFSVSKETASDYLSQTEKLLQTLGVLQGHEKDAAPEAEPPLCASPRPAGYPEDCMAEERHYHLLNSNLRVRYSHTELLSQVASIFSHLEHEAAAEQVTTIDIIQEQDGVIRLYHEYTPVYSCTDINKLGPLAKTLVWRSAIEAFHFFIDIHAGVVGDSKQCFLLPAAAGSGKSTLTAALIHHGFEYFSDELALLQEEGMKVCPAPLALCVKESGIKTLSTYYPHLHKLNLHLRGDGKWARYMPPPTESIPHPDTLRSVGAIVFPQYTPGETTRLENLGHMETLQLLMKECLIVNAHLDQEKVSALLKWIEETPCYRMPISDLNEAVTIFRTLSENNGKL